MTPRGEELGLPEVADIPSDQRQDPSFFRTKGRIIGRDGCRVPLPWNQSKPNYGFGSGAKPHLPMPSWWGEYAVDKELREENSPLHLYRKALKVRTELQCGESLQWVESSKDVLYYRRPNGWEVLLNAGGEPIKVPKSRKVVLSSSVEPDTGTIPAESTVWLVPE